MNKRQIALVLIFNLVILFSLISITKIEAATAVISNANDSRITEMLNAIDKQSFSATNTNATKAKEIIRHFIFNSSFAAIGGGKYPHINNGSDVSRVSDNVYSSAVYPGKGCISYCYFVSRVIYGTEGSRRSEQYHTASTMKTLLQTYGQAGDHIRINGKPHSLTFISCTDNGFYSLEYDGDSTQRIILTYWTYIDFINSYSSYIMWLYDANTSVNSSTSSNTSYGTVTIQYNANGGNGAPASHSVTKDSSGTARFYLSSTIPTRSGYTFLGWRLSNSTAYAIDNPNQYITIGLGSGNSTLTYYAQWSVNTSTYVYYDGIACTKIEKNMTVNVGAGSTLRFTQKLPASSANDYPTISNGQTVYVYGVTINQYPNSSGSYITWAYIYYNGRYGWVSYQWLK